MKKVMIIDDQGCYRCPAVGFDPGIGEFYGCNKEERIFNDGIAKHINNPDKRHGVAPMWCPLKVLPEPKRDWGDGTYSYEKGWNDALKAIGGGE